MELDLAPLGTLGALIALCLFGRLFAFAPEKPRPIAKGSPIYTPPAALPGVALVRAMKREVRR
jgi:hypothetical protein